MKQVLLSDKKWRLPLVTVLFLSFLLLFWNLYALFYAPVIPLNSPPVLITMDKNASASQFVQAIKEKNANISANFLILFLRLRGVTQQLKAGLYQIKPGESAAQLVNRVIAGEVLTHNFTIIPGTTQSKITQDLQQAQHLEFHLEDWDFIKDHHANAEGLLLADTYQYNAGSSSKAILDQAHHNLMDYLNASWSKRDLKLPYKNAYELLTAASIIEKETALAAERQLISGVVVNRLKKGMPLQMDPTVIYSLYQDYRGTLSHEDLLVDSPYNSYKYRGLPPGPIAMVGKEAIDAAAHPHWTNYLYFVAKGDGSHQFSETYLQQREAINQYQHKDS